MAMSPYKRMLDEFETNRAAGLDALRRRQDAKRTAFEEKQRVERKSFEEKQETERAMFEARQRADLYRLEYPSGRMAEIRVLAETLEGSSTSPRWGPARQIAIDRLRDALPAVSGEETQLRDSDEVIHLYRALGWADESLCMMILWTISRLRDTRAIPHVERLASSLSDDIARGELRVPPGPEPSGDSREQWVAQMGSRMADLRDAATECLGLLRIQLDNERLLRPSSGPDSLLRPAAKGSDSEPDNLLRATGPPVKSVP